MGLGDYYFQLAVSVVQIAITTRSVNGGLIPLAEIIERLRNSKFSQAYAKVSEDDVKKAVTKLSILGNGYKLYEVEIYIAFNRIFIFQFDIIYF